jgi:hypothetical protein
MEDSDRPDPVLTVSAATVMALPCDAEAAMRRRTPNLQSGLHHDIWRVRESGGTLSGPETEVDWDTDWWEIPPGNSASGGRRTSNGSGTVEQRIGQVDGRGWYGEGGKAKDNRCGKKHGGAEAAVGVGGNGRGAVGGDVYGVRYEEGGNTQDNRYGKKHGGLAANGAEMVGSAEVDWWNHEGGSGVLYGGYVYGGKGNGEEKKDVGETCGGYAGVFHGGKEVGKVQAGEEGLKRGGMKAVMAVGAGVLYGGKEVGKVQAGAEGLKRGGVEAVMAVGAGVLYGGKEVGKVQVGEEALKRGGMETVMTGDRGCAGVLYGGKENGGAGTVREDGDAGDGKGHWYEEGGKTQHNPYGEKHGGLAEGDAGDRWRTGGEVGAGGSAGMGVSSGEDMDGGAEAKDGWAALDMAAGGDTECVDEWWTPGVHAGLTIPDRDIKPSIEASSNAGARWLQEDRWKDWISSPFYRKVVLYKLRGESALLDPAEDIGRNEAKLIRRRAQRFVMAEAAQARLFYKERSGRLAVCVLESELPKVLHSLHDVHGHFATGVTIGRAYGEYYWPTRDRDIAHWVSTCIHCQRCHTKLRTTELKPIAQFRPMDMLAMDYIGPISPVCKGSGAKYILVMIDYYSWFVFAQPVACADQATTMAMLLNTVVPVVGWPKTSYSDNGSHFVGEAMQTMPREHGVLHFKAAISHASSMGLAERYVRMIIGNVRLQCLQAGSADYWSHFVRNAVITINTRCVRVHGFTPTEILLGFNPSVTGRTELSELRDWVGPIADVDPSEILGVQAEELEAYVLGRDDKGVTMMDKRTSEQHRAESSRKGSPVFRKPWVGDLVLVRDIALSKQHGRKLKARWSTPRIVDAISASGVSAQVRELHHAPGKTKRYHIEDLLVYTPRQVTDLGKPADKVISPTGEYARGAMGAQEAFVPGQRAFHLSV